MWQAFLRGWTFGRATYKEGAVMEVVRAMKITEEEAARIIEWLRDAEEVCGEDELERILRDKIEVFLGERWL